MSVVNVCVCVDVWAINMRCVVLNDRQLTHVPHTLTCVCVCVCKEPFTINVSDDRARFVSADDDDDDGHYVNVCGDTATPDDDDDNVCRMCVRWIVF